MLEMKETLVNLNYTDQYTYSLLLDILPYIPAMPNFSYIAETELNVQTNGCIYCLYYINNIEFKI